ncbi:MAG: hypothetical protein ABIF01_01000 [Candidatus Micrarchaeota archaeon]
MEQKGHNNPAQREQSSKTLPLIVIANRELLDGKGLLRIGFRDSGQDSSVVMQPNRFDKQVIDVLRGLEAVGQGPGKFVITVDSGSGIVNALREIYGLFENALKAGGENSPSPKPPELIRAMGFDGKSYAVGVLYDGKHVPLSLVSETLVARATGKITHESELEIVNYIIRGEVTRAEKVLRASLGNGQSKDYDIPGRGMEASF